MTTITIPRAVVEQALEALEYGQHSLKQISEHQWESRGQLAMDALRAALAQQAEAVAAERERCAEYLMQQAAECRENSPTRVTLESCAAVLRLGLHAQAEPVQKTCPGCEATLGAACGRESCPKGWEAAPPQRKPLSEEEIEAAAKSVPAAVYELMHGHEITVGRFRAALAEVARAVERAHGIGEGA